MSQKIEKSSNNLLYKLLLLTTFFNIYFPKAGIKISSIPLTVGNILFAVLLLVWTFNKIRSQKFKIYNISFVFIMFIIFVVLKYMIASTYGKGFLSYITYIIPLIIYPFIYFIVKDLINTEKRKNTIIKIIVSGFMFICLYGLLQFVVGIGNCDIPGLTVNYTDYVEMGSSWFLKKNNGIDTTSSKIFSTYQNGNLFGINILIIFPIVYSSLKKNKKNKLSVFCLMLFIVSCFLTLSRACWVGIVLFLFVGIIFNRNFKGEEFSSLKKAALIILFLISIVGVFVYLPDVTNRFLNTNIEDLVSMSGRTEGFIEVLESVKESNKILPWFIGPEGLINYTGIAYEMFPIALFAQIGLVGIAIVYYLFIKILKDIDKYDVVSNSVRTALIIWMIVGLIECGYWLPPTALNLFLVVGLAKNKSERECE